MQLRKAWARFFAYTLLIIGLLSFLMLAIFYNSTLRQESNRAQIIDEFVRNQRLDLIKNVVNNMIAEISVHKAAIERDETITKDAAYDAVLSAMQEYADRQVPLGDVEIRVDALNSYTFQGDFATRIITPFFQGSSIIEINSENADYYDILPEIVSNGEAHTVYTNGGSFDKMVYARLYRPYDWVISASVSASDIRQLTDELTEQFKHQQNNYMLAFSLLCLAFTVTALTVFIVLGRMFFSKTDTEFKAIDELTKIDGLTGIYNRRYMDENFDKTMHLLSRTDGHLSVLMVDVDFFKLYNDTYGHEWGDACLKAVAKTLADSLPRDVDFVVRYGGEEFAVVLPGTGEAGAGNIAAKLLENVRILKWPHEKSNVAPYITISIGGTSAKTSHTQDWKDFVRAADKALYISKDSGRNRYTYVELGI